MYSTYTDIHIDTHIHTHTHTYIHRYISQPVTISGTSGREAADKAGNIHLKNFFKLVVCIKLEFQDASHYEYCNISVILYFKVNSVFGKSIQNVQNQREYKLVGDAETALRMNSNPR